MAAFAVAIIGNIIIAYKFRGCSAEDREFDDLHRTCLTGVMLIFVSTQIMHSVFRPKWHLTTISTALLFAVGRPMMV